MFLLHSYEINSSDMLFRTKKLKQHLFTDLALLSFNSFYQLFIVYVRFFMLTSYVKGLKHGVLADTNSPIHHKKYIVFNTNSLCKRLTKLSS